MNSIMDILLRGMDIVERLRTVSAVSGIQMIVFGVLLIFGIINCILGYRLLRFWMMLFGFIIGAGLGFGASFFMGIEDNTIRLAVSVGVGVVLAVIVFLSYKVGIFVLGAGLGIGIAVYVLHPTSSLVFFFCLLAGVGLGSLAMKWAKEVIIVGTSLLGGAMSGMSLAKLGGLSDFPYGIGLSAAFAALGMLIQFATNRSRYEEEDEEPVHRRKKKHYVEDRKRDHHIEKKEYYETPVRKKREPERAGRRRIPVDIQVGDNERYPYDYPIESEKTVVYRPRKKPEPEFDLPLDSYAYDDSYGKRSYPRNSVKKQTYTIRMDQKEECRERSPYADSSARARRREFYADLDRDNDYEDFYDEPIDEDELDDEILREIMEEEDSKSILPWKKHDEKKSRTEGSYGKRGRNR